MKGRRLEWMYFLGGKSSCFGVLGGPVCCPNGWPFPTCWGHSMSSKLTAGTWTYSCISPSGRRRKLMYSDRHWRAALAQSCRAFMAQDILEVAVATLLPDACVHVTFICTTRLPKKVSHLGGVRTTEWSAKEPFTCIETNYLVFESAWLIVRGKFFEKSFGETETTSVSMFWFLQMVQLSSLA